MVVRTSGRCADHAQPQLWYCRLDPGSNTPLYDLSCSANTTSSSSSASSSMSATSASSGASSMTSVASSVGASRIASAQSGVTSVAGSGPIRHLGRFLHLRDGSSRNGNRRIWQPRRFLWCSSIHRFLWCSSICRFLRRSSICRFLRCSPIHRFRHSWCRRCGRWLRPCLLLPAAAV